MAKLIGTAPNQVPTNADLGSLAYMDKDNFDANISELTLGALSREITDTAVDIFVYDTRKDSDGGAWRKRTQHTSWYNEEASATRGSRKEFPAVAVIVAETNQVTIYDGDDPDLPMWMVFNSASNYFLNEPTVSAVTMLNGKLAVTGTASNHTSLAIGDFVSEFCQIIRSNYDGDATSLVNRNQSFWSSNKGNTRIVNNVVNDVAMTVLPNAPIDAATGLPVPTIAVGTDAGASVITDSGSVYDISSTADGVQIAFDDDKKLWVMWNDASGDAIYAYPVSAYTSGDFTNADSVFRFNDGGWSSGKQGNSFDFDQLAVLSNNYIAFGGNYSPADYEGLNIHNDVAYPGAGTELEPEALHANIQSDFSTGWMNGDTKLATLSDTDDTDVTGSELVTNGTFDSDISGWSAGGNATLSLSSNQLSVAYNNANYAYAYQAITTVVGKVYTATALIDVVTGTKGRLAFSASAAGNIDLGYVDTAGTASETVSVTFTATSTTTYLSIINLSATGSLLTDNISVRLAEEDRSVNGNGLQVFGTVTKNPVATGADLVAYSGFSSSNYLEQPYNSDITFGNGDLCIMGWVKKDGTASYRRFFSYEAAGGAQSDSSAINIKFGNESDSTNGKLYVYLGSTEGTLPSTSNNTDYIGDGNWAQFVFIRRSSLYELYINGTLIETLASTQYKGSSTHKIRIGYGVSAAEPFTGGSAALFRVSKTAPSPEQIRKIYEDEKVLFQENAQATLYGSSDAVTALAYDDSTELLHVCTSAGRSVFQGLRRVDNTTTAVGAAISASNGLVADE